MARVREVISGADGCLPIICMNNDRYIVRLPAIRHWIEETLAASANLRRSVSSFGFRRLHRYFSERILATAGVVLVDQVPVPPLSALGLTEFKNFEMQEMAAITFLDTYFLRADHADTESIHLHELVHVVQWKVLGPERFLLLYADGLAKNEYAASPLERMAFFHQARFDGLQPMYDVETEVIEQTLALTSSSFRIDS